MQSITRLGIVFGMNSTKANKATKQTVKILGFIVTVGTKKHAILAAQVKHFNDLAKFETN